ncbi:hypothetical protein [Aquincola sp. J276]|uniref:hypothetical protein n=2 Tax=Aquincola TaxID=391952 RepID=UPI0012EECDAB|nr:hypothetical protein [Aquincola sp. J276]MCR5867076.1 hypothetical protein [Aquincola sp. J276]
MRQPRMMIQKSAHPVQPAGSRRSEPFEPPADKGQKFEPFLIPAMGRDRRSMARELRMDQRR